MTDTWTPPATAVWWDPATTLANVLGQLRLGSGDLDQARVEALIPAAGWLIDSFVDRAEPLAGPPPTPLLQAVLEQVTVELYRRKDAGVGNANDWSYQATLRRYGAADPLADVLAQLLPYKQRFGIG